jgi:hypothetical protein
MKLKKYFEKVFNPPQPPLKRRNSESIPPSIHGKSPFLKGGFRGF